MNEKLKEIASNYWDDDYFTDFDKSGNMRHFLNEYGKHIIRECADWVKSRTFSNELKEELKRHFGFKDE
jgi:hypothetical protein